MKKIFLILFFIFSLISFGKEEYFRGKVLERVGSKMENSLTTNIEADGEEIKDVELFKVRIKNKEYIIESPIYVEEAYNINISKGDWVVVYKNDSDGKLYISDIDKRFSYFWMIGIFCGLALLLARKKGLKSLMALGATVYMIFYYFIPSIVKGESPIIISVIIALLSSCITIFLVAGFTHKGVVAIIGSIGGTIFSGILSYIFVNKMSFSGYPTLDAITYVDILKNIKVKELISSGIILGSMGAIMDVSMSISSAITELRENSVNLGSKELFKSGINIGKDMVGTMINTLILAYIGSSLFDMIIIYKNLENLPLTRLLNYEFIAVEILKSFTGSIGILISIPITAYLGAHLHKRYRDVKTLKEKFFLKK